MIASAGFINPTFTGFAYPVPVIPVKKLAMHPSPHLDEVAGAIVAALFGEDVFPGIRKALRDRNIVFGDMTGTEEQFDADGILPFGTGDKCRFNEHLKEGGDRMPGWCSTRRVANYLKKEDVAALRRLLAEVLRCDTESGCRSTMLAELIKVDNRRNVDAAKRIFSFIEPLIIAIITRESQIMASVKLERPPGEKNLVDYFRKWLGDWEEANGPMEPRIRSSLFQRMHGSMQRKATFVPDKEGADRTYVTELAFGVEAMARTSAKDVATTEQDIADLLEYAFVAMHIDQADFWSEVDRQSKEAPIFVRALLDGEERIILLSATTTDSRNAHKAARHCRNLLQKHIPDDKKMPGVTVVRAKKTGNVQIFSDEELKLCVTGSKATYRYAGILEYPVRMIRIFELKKLGRKLLPSFEQCGQEGDGDDGLWYYFKKGEMFLNGSNTIDRHPTYIPWEELVGRDPTTGALGLLQSAFHPVPARNWCDRNLR